MKLINKLMVIGATTLLLSNHAAAEEPLTLAKKGGCLACHALDKTIVGPAWKDVAASYKDDKDARQKLIDSVLYGSKGKWGAKVHMKAQNKISEEEVGQLADYILSLND